MKQKSQLSANTIAKVVLPHLRHPTKLRLILCFMILGGWYALFFAPLSDQVTETKTLIEKERKRVTVAREINQLKKKLSQYEKCIPIGADVNDLRRHLTDHIRATPLKLIDVKPVRSKAIGPFDAPALQLNVEGRYREIDGLLAWIETDDRLLRVDSIKLALAPKDPSHLVASLTVLGLTDKAAVDAPQPGAASPAEGDAAGSTAPVRADGAKAKKARPVAAAEPAKKVGDVRKQVGELRKKVSEARGNTAIVGGSPGAKETTPSAPTSPE